MSPREQAPWSVPVRLDQIGRGLTRKLSPTEQERTHIAAQLDLASLDRLDAEVEVTPTTLGWRLRGSFSAHVVQTCGVTLEPLPSDIDGRFTVEVVETLQEEPESSADHELGLDSYDPPDVAEEGVVDLGAYVVEHLALELDPFPRKPGAAFEPPAAEVEPSPFAALAKLRRDKDEP